MGRLFRRKSSAKTTASFSLAAAGIDTSDQARLARRLIEASGLTVAIHGPGTAKELSDYVGRQHPRIVGEFRNGCMIVQLPSLTLSCFVFDSPTGAAFLVVESTTDAQADTELLMEVTPLGSLEVDKPWELELASRGETSGSGLAERVATGVLVPPAFVKPSPSVTIYEPLFADLASMGWRPVPETTQMVGANVDIGNGRTQVVFVGVQGVSFRIESFVAEGLEQSNHVAALIAGGSIAVPDGCFFVPADDHRQRAGVAVEMPPSAELTADAVTAWSISLASSCDAIEAQLWGHDQL